MSPRRRFGLYQQELETAKCPGVELPEVCLDVIAFSARTSISAG
jgi:hypothetical protein